MAKLYVKLKKDVEFEELMKYGFKYDVAKNCYLREPRWLSKNHAFVLMVDKETREVYYYLYTSTNSNEHLDENLHVEITPYTLIAISHLLEGGDEDESISN